MKKMIIVFLVGGIVGAGAGFGLGVLLFPFIFLNDTVATEASPDAPGQVVVAAGQFIHADPSDRFHYGSGKVTVYGDVIHLGADFEVGPGPKYKVYLVKAADIKSSDDVKNSEFVDLGALRAFRGSQNYKIPSNVTLSDYKSVVIWCEAFNVLVSPATLRFGS